MGCRKDNTLSEVKTRDVNRTKHPFFSVESGQEIKLALSQKKIVIVSSVFSPKIDFFEPTSTIQEQVTL